MKLKIFILHILFLLITTSCFKELDLEKHRPVPKFVLNCALAPDSVITASISRTWFYTDLHPNLTMKDVKVELYVNGEYKQQMWWEENPEVSSQYNAEGIYMSSVISQVGDHVKIIATGEYGTITAEDIIPFPASLLNVDVSFVQENDYGGKLYYKITFEDPIETTDYYLVKVEAGQHSYWINWNNETLFRPDFTGLDNIFGDTWINGYGGIVFSDELVNGKKYTLSASEEWPSYYYMSGPDGDYSGGYGPDKPLTRTIYLYKISEAYYRYLIVLQNSWNSIQSDLADFGLAEPIRIYSNVEGGTGILGSYNPGEILSFALEDIIPAELIERNIGER